jgi:hypothetical protein
LNTRLGPRLCSWGTVKLRLESVVLIVALSSLGLSSAFAQLGPKPEILNLFQLVARADLVTLIAVHKGSLKYAEVDVLEALKGTPPGPHLRIAFRDFNFTRGPSDDVIIFPDGQKEILFLVPYKKPVRKKDIEKFKDLFTLFKGRQGRMTLPAEGPEIVLGAIRRLAQIGGLDAASQVAELRGLLDSSNPFLLEASLSELERLRVANSSLLPKMILFLGSPSPTLRTQALRLLAQIFESERGTGDEVLDDARAALLAVLERAHNDRDESVRVQAVTAVAAWPNRHEVEGDLRAIAGADRAQAVRYEAERALFKP